jgi:hypothetical protein
VTLTWRQIRLSCSVFCRRTNERRKTQRRTPTIRTELLLFLFHSRRENLNEVSCFDRDSAVQVTCAIKTLGRVPQVKKERAVRFTSFVGFKNEVMETAEPFNLQRNGIGGFEIVQH